MLTIKPYDFGSTSSAGLLISAGGFEDRSTAFARRLSRSRSQFESSLLYRYDSQRRDNQQQFLALRKRLEYITGLKQDVIGVDSSKPHTAFSLIRQVVEKVAHNLRQRSVLVDVSGMTQSLAILTIHACYLRGLDVKVVYTAARSYFPLLRESQALLRAWKNHDYEKSAAYLQSESLRNIHILPEFAGVASHTGPSCLAIFVGFEPNRLEGLVDYYAPDRLIACYGRSPEQRLAWRTDLSKQLHEDIFRRQHVREIEVSTVEVDQILACLHQEYSVIRDHFDFAIAPQCSKMQAVASYLFWRDNPEIQLVFTSPLRFNPRHYSSRAGHTYVFDVPPQGIANFSARATNVSACSPQKDRARTSLS